jgi:hypothetical protein
MTHRLISSLMNFFDNLRLRQEEVDYYISTKNPSNPVDVEFWLRKYEQQRVGKWI